MVTRIKVKQIKKILILFFISTLLHCCEYFNAGSYPYAEVFVIKTEKSSLLRIVDNFKKDHDQFDVPNNYNIKDGKDSHWYFVSFYVKGKVYCTWIREDNDVSKTQFAFIGVYKFIDGNKTYKEINKINDEENDKEKEVFKEKILNPILKENKLEVVQ